jgi:hypothetical protein
MLKKFLMHGIERGDNCEREREREPGGRREGQTMMSIIIMIISATEYTFLYK